MKFEFTLLLKQRAIQYLLLFCMLLTYLSLQNGWLNISHIQLEINQAQQNEETRKKSERSFYAQHAEAGEVGYYVYHNVYHQPEPWSFIALGNQMLAPHIQRIRLLGLQSQLYDGESHHPEYIKLGSFDYAFWLVFFAPLMCIALTHDLKASEHQAQRLIFLQSVLNQQKIFWFKRLFVRWALVIFSLILPLCIFSFMHALPVKPLMIVIGVTLIYTLFWTALCALVSLKSTAINASMNAMLLTGYWLLICLILPNIAQAWVNQYYPIIDGSEIALQHRQLVHNAWDLPKESTLTPFYQIYPQWQQTAPVLGRFHWKWYFAFQHMADVNVAPLVKKREAILLKKEALSQKISWA